MTLRSWPFIAVLLVSIAVLGGCESMGKATDAGAELPTIPNYSKDFRMKFADEIDHVCGNRDKKMVEEHPYTCVFVQDAIVLRAQLKAIKKVN